MVTTFAQTTYFESLTVLALPSFSRGVISANAQGLLLALHTGHSLWDLGYYIECQRLNPRQTCARLSDLPAVLSPSPQADAFFTTAASWEVKALGQSGSKWP